MEFLAGLLWQDVVIAIIQWVFGLALIPAVRASAKPPLWTSVPTTIALFIMAGTFCTLSLFNAAVATTFDGTLWLILAIQKYRQTKPAPIVSVQK